MPDDDVSTDHVLVVGIDGVRYDRLGVLPTPALDRVAAAGFLAPVQVNAAGPTISGPSWATILTGVLASSHRISNNDLDGHALADHPDVAELTRRQRPAAAVFTAAGWAPLVRAESGGPLLTGGGWFPGAAQAHLPEEWHRADQAVTDVSAAYLREHDGQHGSFVFSYLGGVDETGHEVGTGPEYDAFIEASDTRLGELLDAVESRAGEQWTVLVVTDHGHVDGGGHGGDTPEERTAWIAASGPGVPSTAPADLEQADVAGHAAHVLGLTITDPAFVGRPLHRP